MKSHHLLLLLGGLGACRPGSARDPDYGVALDLARERAGRISDLRYTLRFNLPAERTAPVTGLVTIRLALADASRPLVLDFRGDSSRVAGVEVNGATVTPALPAGHVVIPADALTQGPNTVSLRFTANNEALNRNDGFLYTLFVPDRASTAFPVFDQPDLKARWTLQLQVPAGWAAVANGALRARDSTNAGVVVAFDETAPISTYLVAFAAGKFQVEEAVRDGRALTMLHRETDGAKVARNRDAIFDLHAAALRWLENYTGIPYPFGKFAFLAVPSFQFGGMEHPGAIWYRASSLFLDPSATRNQVLGRASLIAHETAHMWFGDLVTMRWFSDVWMKEVFANFMAAKIVEPSFPDVNHDLRFLLAHHPAAYGVDRTLGANPIRQELANLREAGSLYGAIIYQKAPIVMRQLERLVGDTTFRNGLREYLGRYRFGNAGWPELIEILDGRTPEDLAGWSRAWVAEPFRPQVEATWSPESLTIMQRDPQPDRGLRWIQPVEVALGYPDTVLRITARMAGDQVTLPLPRPGRPGWILPGSDGLSYGRFRLDSASRQALPAAGARLSDPVLRAAGWTSLWESLLAGETPPRGFLARTLEALETEPDELVTQYLLGLAGTTFWRFLPDSVRQAQAATLEAALWRGLDRAAGPSRKGAWWSTLVAVTLTPEGLARLQRIWRRREPPAGLPLAELQYTALAEALALREVPDVEAMLDREQARITNPDRLARFRFVRPALSGDPAVRDSAFESFRSVENRRRESWVLDAMNYLGHPLRARQAERYLEPGLGLLEEIQRTGDIFFPLGWLNSLLDGHQSAAAAAKVDAFLAARPDLAPRLRGKLLQSADDLFRAARIVEGWTGGPALEGESSSGPPSRP
ncbi:MAG TPA: M1 family aminopeptidase [Gemmatimonadales bacterium]